MSLNRLEEIQQEMQALLEEAGDIVRRNCSKFLWERAKAYWYTAIDNSLSEPYLKGEATIQECIDYIGDEYAEDSDDDDDEAGYAAEG